MRIRGTIGLISLLGFVLRGASSAADISSENLACVTLQSYSAEGCTGTATTQQFTTYTEPGHSECKAETKMEKTLFTFNNQHCKLTSTPETFQQTMYLFDQQQDCTPLLGLDLFKLDIIFSVDECALGKYKLVSCVAGSCEANETLPDYGTGFDQPMDSNTTTSNNETDFGDLGNTTDTGGNNVTEDLPPPPDTSLGKIDKLCKKSYIAKNTDSDCYSTCEPGACCFLEDMDSCSNNTEGCALYKGCEDVLSSNNTNTSGTMNEPNMTDINGTIGLNETMSGNETIVGGNETESLNGTNATDILSGFENSTDLGNTTDGNYTDLGNTTDGNLTGTNLTGNATEGDLPPPPDTTLGGIKLLCAKSYISEHNDSDCYLTCEPGACCFLDDMDSCSNNTEGCALYKGCEDVLSSNSTSTNGTLSNPNTTDMGVNGTEDGGVNATILGNETSVGGNDTAVDMNSTSALESNGTTTGDAENTTDSGLNGTASSDQNATGTNGTSSVGGNSILDSIGNAIDSIANGTMNNILGNVTIPGPPSGIVNSSMPLGTGPGAMNVTAPGTNDTGAVGGTTMTQPVNPMMGSSAGAATGEGNPPLPDISKGGPAVVCTPPYRKANGNVPCRLTCKPGACCFSTSTDSCADNTETCALYALCEKILAGRLLLRFD